MKIQNQDSEIDRTLDCENPDTRNKNLISFWTWNNQRYCTCDGCISFRELWVLFCTGSVQVFDNGGKTIDRYTVKIRHNIYTASESADSPQGFFQYAGTIRQLPNWQGDDCKVTLGDLPKSVRKGIGARS